EYDGLPLTADPGSFPDQICLSRVAGWYRYLFTFSIYAPLRLHIFLINAQGQ
ncbi:hypothetical protein BJX68DRAFT_241185, partial [Aspergillus pseudodeflectus]